MAIRDLIKELEKLPPEQEIVAYEQKSASLMLVHGIGKTNFMGAMIPVLVVGEQG